MHKVHAILHKAVQTFRESARTEVPAFADDPIEMSEGASDDGPMWEFFTARRKIWMEVYRPAELEEILAGLIKGIYAGAYGSLSHSASLSTSLSAGGQGQDGAALAPAGGPGLDIFLHDLFAYLAWHEIIHPLRIPDSGMDELLCDEAIFRAVKASGCTNDVDALRKVGHVRNAVWDVGVDHSFFSMTHGGSLEARLGRLFKRVEGHPGRLPDGVIPLFDVAEMISKEEGSGSMPSVVVPPVSPHSACHPNSIPHSPHSMSSSSPPTPSRHPSISMFYPLSRLMYGLLFADSPTLRKSLREFFLESITLKPAETEAAVTGAIKGVMSLMNDRQLGLLRVDRRRFNADADALYHEDFVSSARHRYVVDGISRAFINKRTRYTAIEGLVRPLARHVSLEGIEGRHGLIIGVSGQTGLGSLQEQSNLSIMQAIKNVLGLMKPDQSATILAAVANKPQGSIRGNWSPVGSEPSPYHTLHLFASDEYYKRNAPRILLRSPDKQAIELDLGKRTEWTLKATRFLHPSELCDLPLEEIVRFQEETGIVPLFRLSEVEWQYDLYEPREIQLVDYVFKNVGVELPDNLVFHVDSSGSMGPTGGSSCGLVPYVGTRCPYDQLMKVAFGIITPVYESACTMNKKVNVVVVNFSDATIVSGGNNQGDDIRDFYRDPHNKGKEVLLGFQDGGTYYDPASFKELTARLVPGRTVHVFVTDSAICSSGVTSLEDGLTGLVSRPDTVLLYFHLGGASMIGEHVRDLSLTRQNVKFFQNPNLDSIRTKALEVSLMYTDGKGYALRTCG